MNIKINLTKEHIREFKIIMTSLELHAHSWIGQSVTEQMTESLHRLSDHVLSLLLDLCVSPKSANDEVIK
jgi:hypothetical protein